jgi:DNA-directed RNA polymerase specialized sigma24 family protein
MVNEAKVKSIEQRLEMQLDNTPGLNSIEEVYDAYASLLFGYILKIIDHKDEAEAILVSVFVNFSQNRGRYYENRSLLFISLLNSARNEAIDALIKKYQDKISSTTINGKPPVVNETSYALIQKLPLFEKTIAALIQLRGYSVAEVADFLKVPVKIILRKMEAYPLIGFSI